MKFLFKKNKLIILIVFFFIISITIFIHYKFIFLRTIPILEVDKNMFDSKKLNFNNVNLNNSFNIAKYEKNNKLSSDNINRKNKLVKSNEILKSDKFLTIPIINLYKAPIKNGTSQEVMKKYIGHFETTSYDKGNIGLASHNRGMGANYFKDIHKLKYGDYILYMNNKNVRMYRVNNIVTINSYDWKYLQKTKENKITLITCIDNKPNLRLCVQAKEVK